MDEAILVFCVCSMCVVLTKNEYASDAGEF